MKNLIMTALVFTAATPAFASRGAGVTNASEFITESIEHSTRQLAQSESRTLTDLSSVDAVLVDADTVSVNLTLGTAGSFAFTCDLVDDWSHGGTILKKEVRCSQ